MHEIELPLRCVLLESHRPRVDELQCALFFRGSYDCGESIQSQLQDLCYYEEVTYTKAEAYFDRPACRA